MIETATFKLQPRLLPANFCLNVFVWEIKQVWTAYYFWQASEDFTLCKFYVLIADSLLRRWVLNLKLAGALQQLLG